jgi:O-antigen/teichoic acid export membrane protein
MTRKKLLNNSMAGIGQLIITSTLALLSIPVFINKLGIEQYGVFAVLSVVGSLNTFVNLGLNQALIVFISKQGKTKESNYDIVVTFLFLLLIVICLIILTMIFTKQIITGIFSIPDQYYFESKHLLVYLVIANSLLLLGNTFTAIIDSQQKIYLTNLSQALYRILYWGGLIFIVSIGGNLSDTGKPIILSASVWFLLVLSFALKTYGKISLKGFRGNIFPHVKKQINYGGKIYLSGLAGFTFEPLSILLTSSFLGISSVAVFDIAIRLKSQLFAIVSKALYPLFPYIASSVGNITLNKKIFAVSRIIQIITIPISIVIIFTFPFFLDLWLGDKLNDNIMVFSIVMSVSVMLFSSSVLPIYQFLLAKNLPEKTILIQIVQSLVNVVVFFSVYKIFSVYAILVSNTFGFIASFTLCQYYQLKYIGRTSIFEKVILFKSIGLFTILLLTNFIVKMYFDNVLLYFLVILMLFPVLSLKLKLITHKELVVLFGEHKSNQILNLFLRWKI